MSVDVFITCHLMFCHMSFDVFYHMSVDVFYLRLFDVLDLRSVDVFVLGSFDVFGQKNHLMYLISGQLT